MRISAIICFRLPKGLSSIMQGGCSWCQHRSLLTRSLSIRSFKPKATQWLVRIVKPYLIWHTMTLELQTVPRNFQLKKLAAVAGAPAAPSGRTCFCGPPGAAEDWRAGWDPLSLHYCCHNTPFLFLRSHYQHQHCCSGHMPQVYSSKLRVLLRLFHSLKSK